MPALMPCFNRSQLITDKPLKALRGIFMVNFAHILANTTHRQEGQALFLPYGRAHFHLTLQLSGPTYAVTLKEPKMTLDAHVSEPVLQENSGLRTNWSKDEIMELFQMPFMDLIYKAAQVHRLYHDPNKVQLSQLISIKTGGCAEDCGYCSQSAKYKNGTGLDATKLMEVERVLEGARRAPTDADSWPPSSGPRRYADRPHPH